MTDQTTEAVMPPRRLAAGLRSLAQRANFCCEVDVRSGPRLRSHYGDTDLRLAVQVGDLDWLRADTPREPPLTGRRAAIVGSVVLHRTVGHRIEWLWDPSDVSVFVWPTGAATCEAHDPGALLLSYWPGDPELSEEAIEQVDLLNAILRRVVESLAARLVEQEAAP